MNHPKFKIGDVVSYTPDDFHLDIEFEIGYIAVEIPDMEDASIFKRLLYSYEDIKYYYGRYPDSLLSRQEDLTLIKDSQ